MFTPDQAADLAGPDWLRGRRIAAAERFAATEMPTFEEEIWRYTPIGKLRLDEFSLADEAAGAEPGGLEMLRSEFPQAIGLVWCRNGVVVHAELDDGVAAKGVHCGRLLDAEATAAESALGSVMTEAADVFAEMNDAFAADPVLVAIPEGVDVDGPIVVINDIDSEGGAVFPRLVVRAGANSEARVLDVVRSTDVKAFCAPVVELDAAPSARLGYLNVQDLGPSTWQIASQLSRVEAQATLNASTAAFGGDYARVRTDCRLIGRGATGNLLAVYFGDGDQTLDFRTFQDHVAPDTTSNLLFKGALDHNSRSVYTGLIRVRPDARGTNAFQTNRNIKLSPEAWAESVPNLEIENNEVKCSHASTVGPIDEEQRFYLESRGVPPLAAEQLIVTGFFDEVFEQLPLQIEVPALRARVQDKLASSDA